jgi:hypothetical protein
MLLLTSNCLAAIAFVSSGAAATGITSLSIAYPSTPAAGDLILCFVASKDPSTEATQPTGFLFLCKRTGVAGGAVAANAGPTTIFVFYKISDGTETGSVSTTITGADQSIGRMLLYSKSSGAAWDFSLYTSGEDSTSGTGVAVVGGAGIDLGTNDLIVAAFSGTRGNTTNSAQSFSATSATFAAASERIDSSNSSSPGVMLLVSDASVTTGSNNAPTASFTTASGTLGPAVIFRLRETTLAALPTLVFGLPLQESSGATTVATKSGATVTTAATLAGGDTITGITAADGPGDEIARSFNLDGTNDYISFADLSSNLADNFTICTWVKLDVSTPAGTTQTGFANMGPAGGGGATHYVYTDGNAYLALGRYTNSSTPNRVTMSHTFNRAQWHHVAITSTAGASNYKVYINGVYTYAATGQASVYWTGSVWTLGRAQDNVPNLYYLDGLVADWRVYSGVVSPSQLTGIIQEKDLAASLPPSSAVAPLRYYFNLLKSN